MASDILVDVNEAKHDHEEFEMDEMASTTHVLQPWVLRQVSQDENIPEILPGFAVYEFTRAPDSPILCFAQTDVEQLYSRYPGMKKTIARHMKELPYSDAKAYFKTKPNENRADFTACFSSNATNGKCLVPIDVVHAVLSELEVEREVRRDSISSFLSRMNRFEKEWVLQEIMQSIGMTPSGAVAASAANNNNSFHVPLAPGMEDQLTPSLNSEHSATDSPLSVSTGAPLAAPTFPTVGSSGSFFDLFVRNRGFGDGLGSGNNSHNSSFSLPPTGGSNSHNSSFALMLGDEGDTNPLFGSLFGGDLEGDRHEHEHKRKRINSIDTDEPTMLPPLTAAQVPQVDTTVRLPFVPPVSRDREWVHPQIALHSVPLAPAPLPVPHDDMLSREGSLLFGIQQMDLPSTTTVVANSSAYMRLRSFSQRAMR